MKTRPKDPANPFIFLRKSTSNSSLRDNLKAKNFLRKTHKKYTRSNKENQNSKLSRPRISHSKIEKSHILVERNTFCENIGDDIKKNLKSQFENSGMDSSRFSKEKLSEIYEDLGLDVKLIGDEDVREFSKGLTDDSVLTERGAFIRHLGKIRFFKIGGYCRFWFDF